MQSLQRPYLVVDRARREPTLEESRRTEGSSLERKCLAGLPWLLIGVAAMLLLLVAWVHRQQFESPPSIRACSGPCASIGEFLGGRG